MKKIMLVILCIGSIKLLFGCIICGE